MATFLPASRTMSSVSAGRVSDSFVKHFRWRIPGYETNRLVEPALFVGRKFSSRKVNLDSKLLQSFLYSCGSAPDLVRLSEEGCSTSSDHFHSNALDSNHKVGKVFREIPKGSPYVLSPSFVGLPKLIEHDFTDNVHSRHRNL